VLIFEKVFGKPGLSPTVELGKRHFWIKELSFRTVTLKEQCRYTLALSPPRRLSKSIFLWPLQETRSFVVDPEDPRVPDLAPKVASTRVSSSEHDLTWQLPASAASSVLRYVVHSF
jgi:hypothetical protein